MIGRRASALALLLLPALLGTRGARAQEPAPVVHALLFYSPTCPHCEELINNRLPPLLQRYGKSLDVIGINVATQGGLRLYQSAVAWYRIPLDRQGVPTLIIGSRVLVGEDEIPMVLPQVTDSALAHGGLDWPEAPEIRQALEARGLLAAPTPEPSPPPDSTPPDSIAPGDSVLRRDSAAHADSVAAGATAGMDTAEVPSTARGAGAGTADTARAPVRGAAPLPPADLANREAADTAPTAAAAGPPPAEAATPDTVPTVTPGLSRELDTGDIPLTAIERFRLDPVGNATAVAVLFILTGILVLVGFGVGSSRSRPPPAPVWLVPLLCVAGMAVAAYLAFVEATGTEAICGPVGDCNTVQQSAYAYLFGVVPVGVLGLIGYAVMLVTWLVALRATGRVRHLTRIATWAMAAAATLFSIYLTFLEPFVIGATCAWCLTSAITAGLLLLATTPAAVQELRTGNRTHARTPHNV